MTRQTQSQMTVDEFLVWAEDQPGRWELYNGVPYAMAPERVKHGKVKFAVQLALQLAIKSAGLPCHMQPDGATVRVSATAAHEPDALVYCGQEHHGDDIEVPNPIIVVEVASPSTRKIDATLKLKGYFGLPSVRHYLIVDPDGPPVILHSRRDDGGIETRIVAEGQLQLDPPGVTVAIADLFAVA